MGERAGGAGRVPLRVLVKGASTVVFTSWMDGPRHQLTYPRVAEVELLAAGQPAEVRVTAFPAERVKKAFRTWQRDALPWSPDVVVLHYGHADSIHLFLPRWLERHVNSLAKRPGRVRALYRKLVLRPVWIALANVQKVLDRLVGDRVATWRSRRVAADIVALAKHVRWVSSPLVLVPETHRMGGQYESWFPRVQARMDRVNALVAEGLEALGDPEVRVLPLRRHLDAVTAAGRDPVLDGSHFTPEVHRLVGESLAGEVLAWAREQPHLDLPPPRAT